MPESELEHKYERLKAYLKALGSVAVAFSGGVDSAFLMYAAKEALGKNAVAFTCVSLSFPEREMNESKEFCAVHDIDQTLIEADEMSIEAFRTNQKDRCYHCKKQLFSKMQAQAERLGIACIAEGSNLDDNGDYRPGLRAIAELGIKSPLRDCGFSKQDIRELSRKYGLPTWNKQSFACLASRFPYGEEITKEKLSMVGRAEQVLLDLGFRQLRVRIHGTIARIEVLPEEFSRLIETEIREKIVCEFKEFGFSYVTIDLQGYRTGSMNETLTAVEKAKNMQI